MKITKRLLRLFVACTIKHDEEYYQKSMQSKNVDLKNITHSQIAAWKATMKIIEADMLIDMAWKLDAISKVDDVDLKFLNPNK